MLALALSLALSIAPPADAAARLVAARPGATALRATHGGLAHLSGFAEPPLGAAGEASARRFLARHGAAFGAGSAADPAALETLRTWSAPAAGGGAVFRRRAEGLPIFGGEVAVGWRGDGAITVVNGSPQLATEPAARHGIDARAAVEAAHQASLAAADPAAAEAGWVEYGGKLHPVFRVAGGRGRGAIYSYVDAAEGRLLWRASRARTAAWSRPCLPGESCIRSFLASPLAPPPADGGGNPARDWLLQGLTATPAPGAKLTGASTAAYDCAGFDVNSATFPEACETGGQTAAFTLASGADPAGFVASPDPTQIAIQDAFAQQSAYFHVDAHARFLKALDAQWAGLAFIPSYVNVRDGASPLDNAFFSPVGGPPGSAGLMIFGQGALADLAYDAEILYHELTHAAVDTTAGFQGVPDSLGVNSDPDAINEGTADTFAFAHLGESLLEEGNPVDSASCLSRYFGAANGLACLREARNERTCRGAGPNAGRNPGRTGEVHDDGEIWAGFTWELYAEASRHGQSLAMAQALFQAMRIAGPTPSFPGLAATVLQKIRDLGLGADAEAFAACAVARRDLAGCAGRTVPLYSGERAQGVVYGLLSSSMGTSAAGQQYYVDVPCGATALRIQTGDDLGTGTLYVRYGRPVEFAVLPLGAPASDWILRGNHAEAVISAEGCLGCVACSGGRTAAGAGRWYFLATGEVNALFHLGVTIDAPSVPTRPAFALGACAWPGAATPEGGSPPPQIDAPPLACAAPGPAPACTGSSGLSGGGAPSSGGCGCGHLATGDALLALAGLLALRRSRGGRGVRTFRA